MTLEQLNLLKNFLNKGKYPYSTSIIHKQKMQKLDFYIKEFKDTNLMSVDTKKISEICNIKESNFIDFNSKRQLKKEEIQIKFENISLEYKINLLEFPEYEYMPLFLIENPNNAFGNKEHPSCIVGCSLNNTIIIYNNHFTTTNKKQEKIWNNIKIGGEYYTKEELDELEFNNPQAYNIFLKYNTEKRPIDTWYLGNKGNIPLLPIDLLPNGKMQYCSNVTIETTPEQFWKIYSISNEEKPPIYIIEKTGIIFQKNNNKEIISFKPYEIDPQKMFNITKSEDFYPIVEYIPVKHEDIITEAGLIEYTKSCCKIPENKYNEIIGKSSVYFTDKIFDNDEKKDNKNDFLIYNKESKNKLLMDHNKIEIE